MRKSRLELLQEARRGKSQVRQLDFEGLAKLLCAPNVPEEKRDLNPTQRDFIHEKSRIAAYMGRAGVAKTSTVCAAGFLRALLIPDTRLAVFRHDYTDLKMTTYVRMQEMLEALPKGTLLDRSKSPPEHWILNPIGDGAPSHIWFMGLKDDLGSIELTDAVVDECDEVEEKRVRLVNTRLRYVRAGFTPEEHKDLYSLRVAFNPPDKNHWLYTACTGRDFQEKIVADPWIPRVYRPRKDENNANLPPDYHENLRKGLSEDLIVRLLDGDWGATFPGEAVYRQYSKKLHERELKYDAQRPLFRFWDFGYQHPFCIWAQFDWLGRLRVLSELAMPKVEATQFARRVVSLTQERYPGALEITDYGDPAANQQKDTGRTLTKLQEVGVQLYFQGSSIERGVDKIRELLSQLVEGEPLLQFDPKGCPILCRAMQGGYHMDDHGLKPKKDGYYDHPADAFRYGIINLFGGGTPRTGAGQPHELPDSIEYSREHDR